MTLSILSLLAGALYLSAAWRIRIAPRARSTTLLAGAALLVHAGALVIDVLRAGQLHIGIAEAGSLFAWQAALLLWLVCLRQPLQILGLALYPAAAVALVVAALAGPQGLEPVAGWRSQLHVLLSLLGTGVLTLAAVHALFLALQDRLLHRHRDTGLVQSLPPLQTMERLLFQLIALGFFLLSLSLLSGLWFIRDWFAQHLVHKTVLSLAAWVLFGVLLWGRGRYGWRGRTAIHWTLGGYLLLVLAYFGSRFVLEEILGRQWT